jgi:hypothetical protein
MFNQRPLSKAAGIAVAAAFLAGWTIVMGSFYWFGRRATAELSGPGTPARNRLTPRVNCTFEFTLPDGRAVRGKDSVLFDKRFGTGPPETVLYDPTRPERALLVHSLRPGVCLSPLGEWESRGGWVPWLGLAMVAAVVAAAFALFS